MVYPPKSVSLTPAERKDLPTPPPVAQELKNQKFKIDYLTWEKRLKKFFDGKGVLNPWELKFLKKI